MEFPANSDRSSVVTNTLAPGVNASYIRIHPQTYSGRISMRVEFRGCYRKILFIFIFISSDFVGIYNH